MTEYTIINDGLHAFGVQGISSSRVLSVRGFATELEAAAWIAGQQASEAMAAAAMISLEPGAYDSGTRRMVGPHGEARLTPSEHILLMCLAQRRGMMVAWNALIGALWVPDDEPEAASDALQVHICHLRAKLRRVGATARIDNVWAAGFVLSAPPVAPSNVRPIRQAAMDADLRPAVLRTRPRERPSRAAGGASG
jgi:DNA-binding winged helix-turn-helix (wHTH) protein